MATHTPRVGVPNNGQIYVGVTATVRYLLLLLMPLFAPLFHFFPFVNYYYMKCNSQSCIKRNRFTVRPEYCEAKNVQITKARMREQKNKPFRKLKMQTTLIRYIWFTFMIWIHRLVLCFLLPLFRSLFPPFRSLQFSLFDWHFILI